MSRYISATQPIQPYSGNFQNISLRLPSLEHIDEAAEEFLAFVDERRRQLGDGSPQVYAFEAPMGTGKTTFIAAVARRLGVTEDAVSSPTFAIVNEYRGYNDRAIFHFDCYRIDDCQECLDMGAEDYLYSGELCLIEWPAVMEPLLPGETVVVNLDHVP